MKFSSCIVLLFFAFTSLGFAHDANKAFFNIQQKDNLVEVKSEFPWSIRNALLEANPELENSKNKADFDAAFFDYVKTNFELRNGDSILKLIAVEEVMHYEHSHANAFVFLFEGIAFDAIKNTLMFNAYKDQENYHDVLIEDEHLKFITSPDSSVVVVQSVSRRSGGNTIKIGLILIIICVLGVFLWIQRKKS
ncbi:hypothetical protein ADIWIN_3011 [Winogradskyella psychrotolerans RS-3]|uniref:Uncharacterized protein n=1 Tax=Winogradskyella psychrotolerans RS-3 TaxID=641526 RepID=S7VS31_9FLAO|nr:hypothetical protein [Winogradskyella psychrotolerans]EPR72172.1 hypothetical protein ADIWIN_3011 [Winogradskyella psychrotolerans RS-3]